MKITKRGITFNASETELIKNAFYLAYHYEKDKSHLYDADKYLSAYYEIIRGTENEKQKES